MNSGTVWVGHRRDGGRLYLKSDELRPGINLLGRGADGLAGTLAAAFKEAGLRILVLDFDGRLSESLSGCLRVRALGEFLYDSMSLEEKASLHAELAASAYTMALNLSFEQEGFLNSAIQIMALEEGIASPSGLSDRLAASGEFRGHTADELKGKLGALKSLNVVGEKGVVGEMVGAGSVASFAAAESHQAAEVAMLLLLSKVLALGAAGVPLPDALVVCAANRVFPNLPLTRHGNRILVALMSSPVARVFAAETTYGLDHHFTDTSHIRILSSVLWNEGGGAHTLGGLGKSHRTQSGFAPQVPSALLLTPNMFVLQDLAHGREEVFVPRRFDFGGLVSEARPEPLDPAQRPPGLDDRRVVKGILEIASTYEKATRASIVSYLSSETPRPEVEKAIDRLQNDGYLTVVGRDAKRDDPIQSVRLTKSGYELLRSLD